MKRLYSFITIAVLSISGFAQLTYEDGPVMPPNENGKISKLLGGDNTSFYTIIENGKGKGQHYFIEKYALADYKKEFSVQVDAAENAQTIESYYTGTNCLYFYCTQESKNSGSTSLFYSAVDKTGKAAAPVELAKANNRKPEKNVYVIPNYYFTIAISPNKKHLLAVVTSFSDNGKDSTITAHVYDASTMKQEREVNITDTPGRCYKIDDDSNVLFLFEPEDTDDHFLVLIDKLSKAPKKNLIKLQSDVVAEGVNIVTKENNIYVGGFFLNTGEAKNPNERVGMFFQQFSLTNGFSNFSSEYFSKEMFDKVFGDEDKVDKIHLNAESFQIIGNDIYFIGRDVEKKIITHTHTSYRTNILYGTSLNTMEPRTVATKKKTTSANYKSNYILVFKVNAQNKIEWQNAVMASTIMPTSTMFFLYNENTSKGPEIISGVVNNKLVLIHCDTRFVMMSIMTSNVNYTVFDEKGNTTTDRICDEAKKCFVINAHGIYNFYNVLHFYDNNKLLVYYNQKDNIHFGRIIFK